jgi:hypothetical protein
MRAAIGISMFGISKFLSLRMLGHFKSRNSGNNLDHPFVVTRGRDRATHRYIDYRGFELTESFCHRSIENFETMRLDQGRSSTWNVF